MNRLDLLVSYRADVVDQGFLVPLEDCRMLLRQVSEELFRQGILLFQVLFGHNSLAVLQCSDERSRRVEVLSLQKLQNEPAVVLVVVCGHSESNRGLWDEQYTFVSVNGEIGVSITPLATGIVPVHAGTHMFGRDFELTALNLRILH